MNFLEDNMFDGLVHARTLVAAWSRRFNEEHPHSALGWLSPTSTRTNGHNTSKNNQQPHNTRSTKPDQATPNKKNPHSNSSHNPTRRTQNAYITPQDLTISRSRIIQSAP